MQAKLSSRLNKKKVVIVANDTTYVYNLRGAIIKELIKQNYEVFVVSKIILFEKELNEMGCHLINTNFKRKTISIFSNAKLLFKYKKILNKVKPDYILSYNIKPNIYCGIINNKMNVTFMPNITGLGKPLQYQNLIQKIVITLLRYALKKANVVFFQNSSNIDFFKKYKILSKKSKVVLLPGSGVDLTVHKVLPYPKGKKIKFIFISRILKEKGIDIYLETAEYIKKKYPNTEFHICGYCDDEKYKKILSDLEKKQIIIYHGEQKNIIPFYKMANAIIHPSYYPEGMSNVLLQAAAHARPIICAANVGCKETVENKKTGFIVPIKNTSTVIEAVEKIINMSYDERKQMGLNGRAKIEKEFDRNIVVNKYMNEIVKS